MYQVHIRKGTGTSGDITGGDGTGIWQSKIKNSKRSTQVVSACSFRTLPPSIETHNRHGEEKGRHSRQADGPQDAADDGKSYGRVSDSTRRNDPPASES